MDKITYLAELAEGLARWVPERERQDILRYYAEYFEEAGSEREAEVMAELGDPWALSCRLAVEGGFVTQEAANSWMPRRNRRKTWPFVLAGTLAAVVIVGVSVASLASKVGRFVGRFAGNTAIRQVTVAEGTDYAWTEPDGPYVEFVEGDAVGGFWNMEDGYLDPFYAIDADISMGNITITGGTDYTLAIQQSSSLAGYRVKWELQGDTLKIRDGGSGGGHVGLDGLGDLMSGGQRGVDVIVTVPEGAVLHKITAKTDFGDVRLLELYVEEKVTATTNLGNVEGCNIRTAGKVELKTDCGNVTFSAGELYDSVDIDLNTSLGDVEVNLNCYEKDCRYELKTDLGNVSINGVDRGSSVKSKGNTLYKLDAESDLGNVAVYFRDDRWE